MRSSATERCGSVPGPPRINRGLAKHFQDAGRVALDLLLPPHCAACDTRVEAAGRLCAACFARTSFITEPCCDRCGVAFASSDHAGAKQICLACEGAPPLYRQARAGLTYDAQGRRLILPFKHADRTELASMLATHMARPGSALLARADVLVPVPLHRARLFQRRYNQAVLLAAALGRLADRPVLRDCLRRIRATMPLGDKSAAERAAEVAEAFAIRPERQPAIAGRQVLLIDDVMTSGATANACASVLLAAGAEAVDVLVAARVPRRDGEVSFAAA